MANSRAQGFPAGSLAVVDPTFPVGTVIQSMLTLAQFQSEMGSGWVLMNGDDVTGSEYATVTGNTVLPDARGEFIRGLDNGRGVDSGRTLGSSQGDEFKSHTHVQNQHRHSISGRAANSGSANHLIEMDSGGSSRSNNTNYTTATNQNTGGSETRPRNIAVNVFIKIN